MPYLALAVVYPMLTQGENLAGIWIRTRCMELVICFPVRRRAPAGDLFIAFLQQSHTHHSTYHTAAAFARGEVEGEGRWINRSLFALRMFCGAMQNFVLPFSFPFFNRALTELSISPNGGISFDLTPPCCSSSYGCDFLYSIVVSCTDSDSIVVVT